jgi:exopolyphosphatase/guanosine-5'-triphosphate,3'-diphosphate pyrophosphatase
LKSTPREATAIATASRPGRVAVIDIGSNSVRLVVFDKKSRCPVPIFNEKALPGLGRGVESGGKLNVDGKRLALTHVNRFVTLAKAMHAVQVDLIATAAMRDASDGPAFAREIEQLTGQKVQIISGEHEARLSAMGVIAGIPEADGIMGDLGGGSVELVQLNKGVIAEQVTLPLGPLRLIEATSGNMEVAQRIIDKQLENLSWLGQIKGRTLYPVGGTWRSLARIHMEQSRYPLHVIHEYRVGRRAAEDLAKICSRLGRKSLSSITGISRRRVDTLPYGALVLERILRIAKPDRVLFSAYGLREGHVFSSLDGEAQRADPLLVGCADLAGADGRFGSVSDQLDGWIAPLFADESDAQARLRVASCLLSDIAWREHPDYRPEQAFTRVLRLPVAGITHGERVTLALTIAMRYGGSRDDGYMETLWPLINEDDEVFATRIGAAIRLAYSLSGGTSEMLRMTSLLQRDGRIELLLPHGSESLFGEQVSRRLEAVGRAFGLPVAVV